MKRSVLTLGILAALFLSGPLQAQTFSSGSTGADGALDISAGSSQILQVPSSGVFNFTTVNVGENTELRFVPNQANSPVTILASGDVVIRGAINVNASSVPQINGVRTAGPGGFAGGFVGSDGFGPGGGLISTGASATWVGPLTLVPPIGGSGGAGSTGDGGGGGGAIVIASSGSITVSGSIRATADNFRCCYTAGGSGGAIRLVGNSINVTGSLRAQGWRDLALGAGVGQGVVRLEAPSGALAFSGSSIPPAVLAAINPNVFPPSGTPALTITSIGGFPVPPSAGARSDTVDVLLPTQLSDPIQLVVQGKNIPVGSQMTVSINGSPGATFTPGTLTGTQQSSTAIVGISGLDRTKLIFLFVSTTFDVPSLAFADNATGPDRVAKLRVGVAVGELSRVSFLRTDGTEINFDRVPQNLKTLFGR
jgi:hypothetical protein